VFIRVKNLCASVPLWQHIPQCCFPPVVGNKNIHIFYYLSTEKFLFLNEVKIVEKIFKIFFKIQKKLV